MSRLRKTQRFHGALLTAALVAGAAAILVSSGRPAWTDDRELLKFNASKPYLMILLDTSASMALKMGPGEVWVPGGADNPDSRLYQAKQALFDVFKTVNDVHFGFADYNQDRVRVVAKHWLYFLDPARAPDPATWPISFPLPDVGPQLDGELTVLEDTIDVDTDGDGIPDAGDGIPDTRVSDIGGDVMTFG
ncbi:MAG: VWA domain-containing protein, partial [Thermoanaerobaculia bacterium]